MKSVRSLARLLVPFIPQSLTSRLAPVSRVAPNVTPKAVSLTSADPPPIADSKVNVGETTARASGAAPSRERTRTAKRKRAR